MNNGRGRGRGWVDSSVSLSRARSFFHQILPTLHPSRPTPLGGEGEEWLGSGGCAKKSEQEKRAMVIVCLLFSHRDTALNIIITIPRDVVSNRRKRAVYRKRKMRL